MLRSISVLVAVSAVAAWSARPAEPSGAPPPSRTPVPESTVAPPLSDARVAERGVIRRSDFPHGWTVDASPTSAVKCKATTAARKAASAVGRSKIFAMGPNAQAESAVYVYRTRAAASRHFKPLGGSATADCVARALKRAFAKAEGYTVGAVTTAPLDLEPFGDDRASTRLTIPVSRQGVDADVVVDLVVVRVERAVAAGLYVDAFDPFDAALRTKLTTNQVSRLRRDL